MPLVYGQKAKGRLVVMPVKFADTGYTQPGEVYEIHLDTTSFVGQEEAVIDQLMLLESRVPDLKIVYAEACDCGMKVKFQVVDTGPGQWSIAGIFSILPAIFVLIGVGIIAYMLWKVYSDMPILLVVGGVAAAFLAFYYLTGGKFFQGITSPYTRGPEGKAPTGTQKLETKEKSLIKQAELKGDALDRLKTTQQEKIDEQKQYSNRGADPNPPKYNALATEISSLNTEIAAKTAVIDNIYKKLEKLAD